MQIDEILFEVVRGWIRATSTFFFTKKYEDKEKTTSSLGKPKR
jgi:hypothetical protein